MIGVCIFRCDMAHFICRAYNSVDAFKDTNRRNKTMNAANCGQSKGCADCVELV